MRFKEVSTFLKGLITSVEDHAIPFGAASNSKNWMTKGDKIELRRGYKVLGAEIAGTDGIDGLHVTFKADGTQILYRKRGRKLEYYDPDSSLLVLDQSQSLQSDYVPFGYTSQPKLAQTFQSTITAELAKFQVDMQKVGTPTDNLQLKIYSDDSGSPGTLLTSSAVVDGSTLNSGGFGVFTTVNFLFDSGSLTANTTYWAVISRTGSSDAVNFYRVYTSDDDPDAYTRGEAFYYNGSAWISMTDDFGAGFFYDFSFNQYYVSNWVEVGTNLFPAAAEDEEVSFANYTSLAGNQMFISSPNSGPYKIMTANPGNYSDQYNASTNFQGYIKIKQNRCVLWGRTKDKTGIYGSYIDAAVYTTVTDEVLGSGDGSTQTFSGTLAFKAGSDVLTCFGVTITCTGGETFTDDYNGNLVGSSGGTGTINYMTGAWSVTFSGTAIPAAVANNIKATYQWEDSTHQGVMDFTKSSPRTAGQGFIFRQDDGGGDTQSVESYGETEFCLHRLKTWALTLTADDTNATNLIFRDNVGIPNLRASVATGDGVYYVDDSNEANPKFRLLTLNNISTQVIPLPVSDNLDLQEYRFDKAATWEWGDYIFWTCRQEDSEVNNRVFAYNKRLQTFDLLDWYVSCFATYNGLLVTGDSLSGSVNEMFSGFDDNEAAIGNLWEGNLTDFELKMLKKLRRLWVQGEISRDQTLEFYASIDRAPYVKIGTQNGADSNVDTLSRYLLGTEQIGQITIGGQGAISVYNYVKDIPFRLGKFNHIKLKVVATGIGYASVSTITFMDIIENYHKLPSKYRTIN